MNTETKPNLKIFCLQENIYFKIYFVLLKILYVRSKGVFKKKFFENTQQIYRRTPRPKCDFNKVALQLYWNFTSAWVFSYKFAAYFQNTSGRLLLWDVCYSKIYVS